MKTEIKDEAGVTMAGPDEPALAAAKARDMGGVAKRVDARSPEQMSAEFLEYQDTCRKTGRPATNFEDWAERTFCGSFQSASEEEVPLGGGDAYLKYTDEMRAIGQHPLNHEDWASRRQPGDGIPVEKLGLTARQIEKRGLMGGSAGAVSREQAGILPTGRIAVSDDMVARGFAVAQRVVADRTLEPGDVRAILEAALHG